MISIQIRTNGADTGVCTVSSVYGAVCLLENAAGDGIDTYRLSTTDWSTALGQSTQSGMVTSLKAVSGALQDKTATDANGDPSYVDWLDYYHCTPGTNWWTCTAFQPELNTTNGVA